jgi:DNA polymerase
VITAAEIAGCPESQVGKDLRQQGKVAELALQFLGGVGALNSMARNYGLPAFSVARGESIRDAWRRLNPWAQSFGYACERAVFAAMRNPGVPQPAGRVQYLWDGGDWLWCQLPSGRYLAYHAPRISWVETPWGEERTAVTVLWGSRRPKAGKPWPRRALYPGLLVENNTQATAADLQRLALLRADALGVPLVMHVHDELIAEGHHLPTLERVMLRAPDWAKGLPLEVEGNVGVRYAK